MSIEANKEIVRRYQDALNNNQLDLLDEVLAEDFGTPNMLPGFGSGLEAAKQIHRATLEAWPDFNVTIDELIGEGDRVAARITMTGTAVRPAFGAPGTGNSFRIHGMYVVRIANGKIVEHAGLEDALSLMQQIKGEAQAG